MRFLASLIFSFFSNSAALLAADYFITGFEIEPSFAGLAGVAGLLTLINIFIRPIIKLLLTPLIIITLGLFTFVINAALLYALDIFSNSLTITGLASLLYSTVLISIINIIVNVSARWLYKRA
ncbi:MAG TPA: phage holin family protein [Candidatus Paceibacterota bacterium]